MIYFYAEATGIFLEVAMQWNDGYKENIFTFANNINTIEGGTHLAGLKSALTKCVNKYIEENKLNRDFGEDTDRRGYSRRHYGRNQRENS